MGESSATMGQEGDCALNPLRTCGGAMEQKLEGDRALNPLRSLGGAMEQDLEGDWALNPPRSCPKCGGRVRAYHINFELDKVEFFNLSLVLKLLEIDEIL